MDLNEMNLNKQKTNILVNLGIIGGILTILAFIIAFIGILFVIHSICTIIFGLPYLSLNYIFNFIGLGFIIVLFTKIVKKDN